MARGETSSGDRPGDADGAICCAFKHDGHASSFYAELVGLEAGLYLANCVKARSHTADVPYGWRTLGV